eukprot:gene35617-46192_t
MASSSRSLFAYDSDSDTALDAVRRENILASQNILAAAMDASVSKFPFLHGGNSSSAQGVIRMTDMSPAEFATFVDGTIYRDFADLSGSQVELTSSSGAAPTRHRSSQPISSSSETRYTIPENFAPPPQTPVEPPAAVTADTNAAIPDPAAAPAPAPVPAAAPIPAFAAPAAADLASAAPVNDGFSDSGFSLPMDAASVIPNYESDRLLHSSFGGRLFNCIALDQLAVGMTILVFGFSTPEAPADSVAGLVAGYVVVNRLSDGSCDAVRAYIMDGTMAAVHPRVLTFFPHSELKSVPILSDSAISTNSFPISIATFARAQNVKMIGVPVLSSAAVPPAPTSGGVLTVESADSQLKRDAREAKLDAVFVLMRGNKSKVDAFVGPQRDLSNETVISAIYSGLTVSQLNLPCVKPDNLPLLLVAQFGATYLALKGKGVNLTLQHALPAVSANIAGQFENLVQVAQALQDIFEILGGIYAAPGTPIGDADPLLFLDITTRMLAQLRSKAHQGTYLGGIPIASVVQAANQCLANFGKYLRDRPNAIIPLADFKAGAAACLDLKPQEAVMDAFTAGHNAVLFIAPQISTFDGSSLPAARSAVAIEGRLSGTKRSLAPTPYQVLPRQAQKQQRLYLGTPAANANTGRSRPLVAQAPTAPLVANRAAQAGPFICVSDFVAKLDGVRFPNGCTTPSCGRRHIPLPPVGQFSAADKAEILQSLQKMKGTRVPSMVTLVQGRS